MTPGVLNKNLEQSANCVKDTIACTLNIDFVAES